MARHRAQIAVARGRGNALRAAFTLLELLIVVVILGVLAAIVIPRFVVSADDARKNGCKQNIAIINQAAERWYFEKGAWPKNKVWEEIGIDPDYFPDGNPTCPVDGSKYELDGTSHRVKGHNH